jgi:hypothetical protein
MEVIVLKPKGNFFIQISAEAGFRIWILLDLKVDANGKEAVFSDSLFSSSTNYPLSVFVVVRDAISPVIPQGCVHIRLVTGVIT